MMKSITGNKDILVLVVEDEPIVRMLAVDIVEDAGFHALEAANADEAMTLLGKHRGIQIVFTDIDMPGSMNGLKLAEAVRDKWPPIHIIIASGHMRLSQDSLPPGAVFFSKPYDDVKLTAEMVRMVG